MNTMRNLTTKFFLSLVILVSSSFVLADVAVIVNSANNASIADSDISRIFLGKIKQFSNGDKITIINLKFKQDTRNEFEKKALNKSASQVKAYWSKLMFSGKGKPPKELGSDKEIIAFVVENPGAIGYVNAASAEGSVKVVKTF